MEIQWCNHTGLIGYRAKMDHNKAERPATDKLKQGANTFRSIGELFLNPYLLTHSVLMVSASIVFGPVTTFIPLYAKEIQEGRIASFKVTYMDFEVREEYLIEAYLEGPEFSVELFVRDGEAAFSAVKEKATSPLPYFVESGYANSSEPGGRHHPHGRGSAVGHRAYRRPQPCGGEAHPYRTAHYRGERAAGRGQHGESARGRVRCRLHPLADYRIDQSRIIATPRRNLIRMTITGR
ncbi:ATP-grasp domain-containing protein [Paenibacillus caseinilyticus]|uniref:ATP-grasp domain-containing protein n=1 Tax=Paenibacillus mucilaginosus TaxID=61624 RepID=UPI00059FA7AF|nr:ATP-grasp domain-containing protein [Paenibacillus mucilaginosus]